jgi:chloride channel 3/4/5
MPIMIAILVSKWVSEGIERYGIYDLVINLNNHPYLDSKRSHVFTSTFAELCTPQSQDERIIIDISAGKQIPASTLREKVNLLKDSGARDSGFPIIKEGVLVGYISASELEYALGIISGGRTDKDQLANESGLCLLGPFHEDAMDEITLAYADETQFFPNDLRPYVDQVSPSYYVV